MPAAGIENPADASSSAIIEFAESARIAAAEPLPKCKLVLGLKDATTVEAAVDLYHEVPCVLSLANLSARPEVFSLRDSSGVELLGGLCDSQPVAKLAITPDFHQGSLVQFSPEAILSDLPADAAGPSAYFKGVALVLLDKDEEADADFARSAYDSAATAASHFGRGAISMRARKWEEAAQHFESSLLYRGDDVLAWWAKNWCLRNVGLESEHDLPNAHYLAPLEPLLRFDAWITAGAEANSPLLSSFEDSQTYLEVAEMLWICGLLEELDQWLREASRRRPNPLFHLLSAAAYLRVGKDIAASEQVSFARRLEAVPSPWRAVENLAIRQLAARFPDDEYLARALRIASASAGEHRVTGGASSLDRWLDAAALQQIEPERAERLRGTNAAT